MSNVLEDLYHTSVVLWVEDELTRAALRAAWGLSPQLQVQVAGRKESVRALTHGARSPRVCGLVDRDLDPVVPGAWDEAGRTVFSTLGHEFENDLLDFDAIAAVSSNGTNAATLERAALVRATALVPWLACRRTLYRVKRAVQGDFPGDPGVNTVSDEDAAVSYILASRGWQSAPLAWATWQQQPEVEGAVSAEVRSLRASLTDGTWRTAFPGKELLRHLRGGPHGLDPRTSGNPTTRDADLAQRIVRAMVDAGRVPAAWTSLRDNLRARLP